jgi:hypothetical protein
LAVVEVELPASSAGAFIPTGNTFDALAAVIKIFALAKTELLVVDPYLDEKIFLWNLLCSRQPESSSSS